MKIPSPRYVTKYKERIGIMKEKDETRDGTEGIVEYMKERTGINLDNEIKQEHTESNPLYEAILADTLETVENAIMTLECSKAHSKDWHVWRAYRALKRLRDRLTEQS